MREKKKSPAGGTGQQSGTIFRLDSSSSIARTATPLQTPTPDQRTSAQIERISSDLFAHLRRGGGWTFIQAIDPAHGIGPSDWLAPGAPFHFPRHLNGRKNVYWGINPAYTSVLASDRAQEKNAGKTDAQIMRWTASKNNSICAVNAFIADLDGKDYTKPTEHELAAAYIDVKTEMQKRLAEGELSRPTPEAGLLNQAFNRAQDVKYKADPAHYKALALAFIQAMPLRPSVLVDSGGGYQCYWLLAEPYLIGEGDSAHVRSYIADLYRRWNAYTGGDPACKDLRRIFRIPGTKNVKPKYAPNYPTADFVWCDLSLTYTLDQLTAQMPARTSEPEAAPRHGAAQAAHSIQPRCLRPTRQPLSAYAARVGAAYNSQTMIVDELLAVGYTPADSGRMGRPGEIDSRSVQISPEKNGSYHHNSNDPLFGEHLRRPFEVRCIYHFGSDYEAAAVALGPALGLLTPAAVAATIAHHRQLVATADWAAIIPLERQSAAGYRTGPADRKLFDNLLDLMERAGKVIGFSASYRQLITAKDANGQPVAIASVQTAKAFLDRLNGVLLDYTPEVVDGIRKGQKISLRHLEPPVVGTLDTPIDLDTIGSIGVSKVPTTGQLFTAHKADDAFAQGCARWAQEVIDAEKGLLLADNPHYVEAATAYKAALKAKPANVAEWRQLMGGLFDTYRELMVRAAADFLPGLGTFGLLVVADLCEHPESTRQDIAARRGLTKWAVSNVLRKLEAWGLAESTQEETFGAPKVYAVTYDVFGQIAEKLPTAKTYKIGVQRLDRRLEHAQRAAEQAAEAAATEEARRLAAKRVTRLAEQRIPTLAALHPNLSMQEVARYVYTPGTHRRPWVDARIEMQEAALRLAERQAETDAMRRTIDDLRRQKRKGPAAYTDALFAGYTSAEAAKIAAIVNGRAGL